MSLPKTKLPPPTQRPIVPKPPVMPPAEADKPKEPSMTEEDLMVRQIITVIAGAGAGATIGYWAFDHAFGRGMSTREKKDLGKYGIALAVLAAATQFGLKDWFTVEGIGEKADKLLSDVGV